MITDNATSPERTALSIVLVALRRRAVIFGACWVLVVLMSCLYAFLAPPVYRVELVMAPAQSEQNGGGIGAALGGQLGQLASIAGVSVGQDDDLQSNLAILESNGFTLAFLKKNQLLPILFEDKWDIENSAWIEGEELTDWEVLEYFNRKVRTVVYDPATGMVRLRIDWYSGDTAAKWANAMGRDLNESVRQRAISEANDSIRYLQQELAKNNLVGINNAINGLIESQISKIMLANVRKDYAFQIIDPAMAPSENSQFQPNRGLILAIGLVLGFLFGAFVAILVEQRDG